MKNGKKMKDDAIAQLSDKSWLWQLECRNSKEGSNHISKIFKRNSFYLHSEFDGYMHFIWASKNGFPLCNFNELRLQTELDTFRISIYYYV